MAKSGLEERLEAITRDFVAEIIATFRNASLADFADLQVSARSGRATSSSAPRKAPVTRVTATPRAARAESGSDRPRQTADRRAELGERLVKALEKAPEPMGVKALSSELGVATDLLAAPLLELRASGKIAKHGEKRATTYSLA